MFAINNVLFFAFAIINQLVMSINIGTVRDMTASHAGADREPVDVVEHHYDLFFWKKYSNYTLMTILHEYTAK